MTADVRSRREPPSTNRAKSVLGALFARADIRFDGERPFDIRVHETAFYERVLATGALGLGESYVEGWWDSDRLDETMRRVALAKLYEPGRAGLPLMLAAVRARLHRAGSRAAAFEVGRRHYDLGNDLFAQMLDPRMVYSCGYWKTATTLAQAQEHKLDLVCRKLGLTPGMRVLEIGCGWGGWAKFAAENYGVRVVGVSVSREQVAYARQTCAGLPIEFRLMDYRDVDERFDRIVSIGMFEHVGSRYYRTFMDVAARCLMPDGLLLLHTIAGTQPLGAREIPWITTYIFPNGEIPSLAQITAAAQGRLVIEALHRFGSDYEQTLHAWLENFTAGWPSIATAYDAGFFRLWTLYLQMARGFFAARVVHVLQIVMSKPARSIDEADRINERIDAKLTSYDAR